MVSLAIRPIPQFALLDYELQKTAPCYTVDTMRRLVKEEPTAHYFLVLGEDAALSLPTWKEVEQLVLLAPPLVGSRDTALLSEVQGASPSLLKCLKKGWTAIPRLEISSTWVRLKIQQGEYAGHLVPGEVWDYIQTHKLYVSQK
jgi:nicotinate-nucleotide adenylyltransferase